MASLDYFVATFARDTRIEAAELRLIAALINGKITELYGYRGYTKDKLTYAINERVGRALIAGTSTSAHEAAKQVFALNPSYLSIARIDVQETITVVDPDRTIAFLTPKKSYKATRVSNVHDEGETLYIGSPASRARIRIYNKTAESGIKPDSGKYLRVEVQLRDNYADTAFQKWINGETDKVLAFWLKKMLIEKDADSLIDMCRLMSVDALDVEERDDEWIDRRKVWYEKTVVPAMAKLFLVDPNYREIAAKLLTGTTSIDRICVQEGTELTTENEGERQ